VNHAWKLSLATGTIFGAGVVGGLMVSHVLPASPRVVPPTVVAVATTNRPPVEPADPPKTRPPELWNQQFVQQLDEVLRLTPPQRQAIQRIICCGQEQIRGICAAQSRQVKQEVRQRIREQLTPEQRKQFELILKPGNSPAPSPAGTNAAPTASTGPGA
jgi:Spy/CpxP family protein refolding chaperone